MASDVDICNLALLRIGSSKRLTSLTETSPEGQACSFLYPMKRDMALDALWWPFATRRARLALLSGGTPPEEAPRSGWRYVYALPTDCLSPAYLWAGIRNPRSEQRVPFTVEMATRSQGRVLLTDAEKAELVYVVRVTEAPRFSPLFVDALAYLLASELARALKKDENLAQSLQAQWQLALARAGAAELSERQADVSPTPDFIAVRE